MTGGWRYDEFAARVGGPVTLRPVDGPDAGRGVPATLTACTDAARHDDLISYRVYFHAGPDAPREQRMFYVEASGRDPEPFFLVPLRDVGDLLEFEAVFNQPCNDGSRP